MPDEENGRDPSAHAQDNPLDLATTIAAIELRVMALESKSAPTNNQSEARELEGIKKGEFAMITVQLATLFVGIFVAFIYVGQLREMRKSTEQTRGALEDSRDSSVTGEAQFDRTMKMTIAQTAAQVQSSQSAENAVKIARDQMRLDQRAWVGLIEVAPYGKFSLTSGFPVKMTFFNSGKTPAQKITMTFHYATSASPISGPSAAMHPKDDPVPTSSIAPLGKMVEITGAEVQTGGTYPESARIGNEILKSHYQEIMDKRVTLYFFGILSYEDAFGNSRSTEYCFFISDPATQQTSFCDSFNDMY